MVVDEVSELRLPLTTAVLVLVLAGGLFCGLRKFATCCRVLRRSASCWSFNSCADDDPPPPQPPGIADPPAPADDDPPTPNECASPAPPR